MYEEHNSHCLVLLIINDQIPAVPPTGTCCFSWLKNRFLPYTSNPNGIDKHLFFFSKSPLDKLESVPDYEKIKQKEEKKKKEEIKEIFSSSDTTFSFSADSPA